MLLPDADVAEYHHGLEGDQLRKYRADDDLVRLKELRAQRGVENDLACVEEEAELVLLQFGTHEPLHDKVLLDERNREVL